jgi:hypothetical protein
MERSYRGARRGLSARVGSTDVLLAAVLTMCAALGCDNDPALSGSAGLPQYAVTFAVINDVGTLGGLQFDVDYLGVNGSYVEFRGSVDCAPLVSVALAAFNDRGNGRLSGALSDVGGFPTPTAVARCTFATAEPLDVDSFRVTVVDAAPVGGVGPPIVPVMRATAVRSIDDTDPNGVQYAVTASVISDSGILGALQFDVTYLGDSGGFVGAGGSVACTLEVDVALSSFNDRGHGRLSAALVDLQGFSTPTPVATCLFKTPDDVAAEDFEVTATDASGPDLQSTGELPEMAITRLAPSP